MIARPAALVVLAVMAPMLPAQEAYVYPAKGQSAGQMAADKAQCQAWATQQTGFDPLKTAAPPQPAPATRPGKGGLLRGGAKGAAVGADAGSRSRLGQPNPAIFYAPMAPA
jgi:hypothetical protein